MEPTNAQIVKKLDSLLTLFERLDDRYRLLAGIDSVPSEAKATMSVNVPPMPEAVAEWGRQFEAAAIRRQATEDEDAEGDVYATRDMPAENFPPGEIEGETAYREDRLEPEPVRTPFPFGSEDFHQTVFLVALHGLLTTGRGNEPAFYPARAKQIADAAVRAYE